MTKVTTYLQLIDENERDDTPANPAYEDKQDKKEEPAKKKPKKNSR